MKDAILNQKLNKASVKITVYVVIWKYLDNKFTKISDYKFYKII